MNNFYIKDIRQVEIDQNHIMYGYAEEIGTPCVYFCYTIVIDNVALEGSYFFEAGKLENTTVEKLLHQKVSEALDYYESKNELDMIKERGVKI